MGKQITFLKEVSKKKEQGDTKAALLRLDMVEPGETHL